MKTCSIFKVAYPKYDKVWEVAMMDDNGNLSSKYYESLKDIDFEKLITKYHLPEQTLFDLTNKGLLDLTYVTEYQMLSMDYMHTYWNKMDKISKMFCSYRQMVDDNFVKAHDNIDYGMLSKNKYAALSDEFKYENAWRMKVFTEKCVNDCKKYAKKYTGKCL